MLVKLAFTQKAAFADTFNVDKVRREAVRFYSNKLTMLMLSPTETELRHLQSWLTENSIVGYQLFNIYNKAVTGKVYFHGVAVTLSNTNDLMLFKLCFM